MTAGNTPDRDNFMTEMLYIRREKDKMRKLINGGVKDGPCGDRGVKNMVKIMSQFLGDQSTNGSEVDAQSGANFFDEILVEDNSKSDGMDS